jgi:antitoxin PrlF
MTSTAHSPAEQYSGKVTPVGNSKGIRFDAAFFKAHPEFSGEVRATVLTDGQVLLSASNPVTRRAKKDEIDPVMLGFLSFIERQMTEHPELIEPADSAQLGRIAALVKGVETDTAVQ